MNPNDELILNWTNTLRHTKDGVILAAARVASTLKQSGYAPGEAMDILIADDYEDDVAEAAIKHAYAVSEDKEEVDELSKPVTAYIVPTSYDDVKTIVENTLRSSSAEDFIMRLARSENPILANLPDNKVQSFIRIATVAKENALIMEALHNDLTPFFENAMYESVRLSESKKSRTTIAATKDNKYTVAESIDKANDVCMKTGTCSCDKYTKGHYSVFGLACEHLVAAANEISPNHKLVKGELE